MSFLSKLNEMIFGTDEEFDEGDFVTNNENEDQEPEFSFTNNRKAKVVNIHATAQLKVVVIQLEEFEEAREIADHLKSRKSVVINLEKLEKDVARRVVDFISGSVYALDGNIQKVANGIFLIAPYNVDIMGDFKDELKSSGLFPWNY